MLLSLQEELFLLRVSFVFQERVASIQYKNALEMCDV